MTNHDLDRHSRPSLPSRQGSSRQYVGGQARVPRQTVYHGPTGTRSRGGNLRGGRGGRSRGGRPIQTRPLSFQGGRGGLGADRRVIILGTLALVLVVLLVVGVSSCVRGCSANEPAQGEVNEVDARVAAGVSEDLTRQLAERLNQNEQFATIATNADQYQNEELLELALRVPETVGFVASYPTMDATAQPYGETVTQGTVPQLWCWDARWGAVDYAGGPLALTGSGPTALSMAYMGLTGATDHTPADIAQAATEAEAATGDSAMTAEFLASEAEKLGLKCESFASNADNLSQMLDSGTFVLLETKAGSLTNAAHWILVTTENEDGSMQVSDPTSPDVSAHPWAPATLASTCTDFYVLSLPGSDDDNTDDAADGATDSTNGTDASSDYE